MKEIMDHRNRPVNTWEFAGVVLFLVLILPVAVFSAIKIFLFGCQGATEQEKRQRRAEILRLREKRVI